MPEKSKETEAKKKIITPKCPNCHDPIGAPKFEAFHCEDLTQDVHGRAIVAFCPHCGTILPFCFLPKPRD